MGERKIDWTWRIVWGCAIVLIVVFWVPVLIIGIPWIVSTIRDMV